MFSSPKNCCLFINLRVATLILAFIQTISFAFQSYLFFQLDNQLINQAFAFGCLFLSLVGSYGLYGVFTKNIAYVRTFAVYYWYEFIGSMIGYVFYAVAAILYKEDYCGLLSDTDDEFVFCHDNYLTVYTFTLVLMGVMTLLRVHYCFSIWAYFRQLQTEQAAAVAAAQETKVTYPQYVYVTLNEKAPTSEEQA
ncbi:hypothetical protein K502DRAFT_339626 [Neoconidiobolus thromboides FSU 785]|nr:hypothetical protein K502DRAFT_339626 [Neoconidiobolus thromboides FSU 785]